MMQSVPLLLNLRAEVYLREVADEPSNKSANKNVRIHTLYNVHGPKRQLQSLQKSAD